MTCVITAEKAVTGRGNVQLRRDALYAQTRGCRLITAMGGKRAAPQSLEDGDYAAGEDQEQGHAQEEGNSMESRRPASGQQECL